MGERNKNSKYGNRLLIAALLVGTFLLAYPSISDYWNSFHQSRAIMNYAEQVARMDVSQYEEMIRAAEAYNRKLAEAGIHWEMTEEELSEYHALLDLNGTGVMGYIDIPKISIKLPVYHGTDNEVLQTSIGHLTETSLPVGGESSHCSLSGHRGLPSAKLFSDLDKLAEGDVFTLSVLNETYSYEVDQIHVVLPIELTDLQISPGQDLCTLITCTPYGVNTHRLLVRGHRVENLNGDAKVVADAMQFEPAFVAPFIMTPFLVVLLLLLFVKTGIKTEEKLYKGGKL